MRSRSRWPAPKINCQQTPKTGHRHSLHAVVAGAVVASALVGLLGTGLNEALPAAATAVPAATSTAVQEVQVPAADLESVGIPGGVSPLVLLRASPSSVSQARSRWLMWEEVGARTAPWPTGLSRWPFLSSGRLPSSAARCRRPRPTYYPGLKSWSFTGSHYVSKYFKLVAFEAPQNFVPPPTGLDALAEQYDRRPYTLQPGSIPFTDLGGHFLVIGALSSVVPLFHLSLVQVAASLRHPDSAVARSVDGTANYHRGGNVPDPRSVLRPDMRIQVRPSLGRQVGGELPTHCDHDNHYDHNYERDKAHHLDQLDHDDDSTHRHDFINDYHYLGDVREHDEHGSVLEATTAGLVANRRASVGLALCP